MDHTTSIIGNGVALDIPRLVRRGTVYSRKGCSDAEDSCIRQSTDGNVLSQECLTHMKKRRLGGKSFGSTKSGIAPFYSDKYAKIGFQVSELFDDDLLKEKVVRVAEQKNVLLEHLYHKPLIESR